MAFGSGCTPVTVTEPTEIESQSLTFFRGTAGAYEYVVWIRNVNTTKTEVRGLSLGAANTLIAAQGLLGNSPKATGLGGGGWNVSYIVTTVDDWTEVGA